MHFGETIEQGQEAESSEQGARGRESIQYWQS